MIRKDSKVYMYLAANRTGKTTAIKKQIKLDKHPRKLIITDSRNPDWDRVKMINLADEKKVQNFKGVRQAHFMEHEKNTFTLIHQNVRNCLIIFDDARDYIQPSLSQNGDFKKILTGFTHTLRSDLIFVFHSPDQAMKRIYDHTDVLFIGNCAQLIDKKMRLDKYDLILETQKKVNAEYQKRYAKGNNSHYGLFAPIRLK